MLCTIFPSIMRVLSSLCETEDWTTLPRYRSTTFASDRIVIYRVCTRERPYLELTSFPPAVDIAIWENWNFTTTPRTIVCALYWERMFHGREDTLIPPLEFVSWHWFELSSSSLLALHVRAKWLSYSPTYTASPRALLTRFLMRIGRRFAENKQRIRLCKENVF